jgi:hypothetical protein
VHKNISLINIHAQRLTFNAIEQKPFNQSQIYTRCMGTEASYFPYGRTASIPTSRAP